MEYTQEYVEGLLKLISDLQKEKEDLEETLEDYRSEIYWLKERLHD